MAKKKRLTSYIIVAIPLFLLTTLFIRYPKDESSFGKVINDREIKERTIDRFKGCEMDCPFMRGVPTPPENNDGGIHMDSFSGYSRTGNYINAMRFAIDLGIACKKVVILPEKDDENDAFHVDSQYSVLDFSARSGPLNKVCNDLNFPIKGNGGTFWSLLQNTKLSSDGNPEYVESISKLKASVHICVMKYLGLCSKDYCSFPADYPIQNQDNSDNFLVVHLREGDIFPPGFESTRIHSPNYGQPPLSYYLQAINFRPWKDILIVTQPGNVGPIHAALKVLNGTRIGEFRLQMSSWYDDLRTCLCAPNLVTSFSTLTHTVFPYGFARRIFSYDCQKDVLETKEYYKIAVEDYPPFNLHTNDAVEWVQTLTHPSSIPQKCT